MRNLQKGSGIKTIAESEKLPLYIVQFDVTDDFSVRDVIKTIYDEIGKINVLVNNAGYALAGAFEDLAIDEIKNNMKQMYLD